MEDDLTQLKEALNDVPPEERAGWISQFIELVKQKGSAKLNANTSLSTLSRTNFENAYQLIVGVMGWELELATGQIGDTNQNQVLELIDSARKSVPFNQKFELEKFRKTESNYPLTGAELFQWVIFNKLESVEKRHERELLNSHARPREQTFVLRYLKALLFRVGYKRPFRLVGGITSFLYNFNADEFARVYDCLMQDGENEYEKSNYEKNLRQHIRDHLKYVLGRFGQFLALGEDDTQWKDFKEVRVEPDKIAHSVKQSLRLLLPWDSVNRLPENFGRQDTSIPFFATRKKDWRLRSVVGRDRRRLLVDQDLLDRMARALDCPEIYGNHFIPRFKKMNKPNTFPPKLDQLPMPGNHLFEEFNQRGEQHYKRLKQLAPKSLFVRVDDEQRGGVYDVTGKEPLHLAVTAEDKIVEIFTHCDGEEFCLGAVVPDAFGVFDYAEAQRAKVSWQLPNGRKIVTRLIPAPDALVDESGVASKVDLFITYKEASLRDLALRPVRWLSANSASLLSLRLHSAIKWGAIWALSALVVLAIFFIVNSQKGSDQNKANLPSPQMESFPSNSNRGGVTAPEVAGTNQNANPNPSPQTPVVPQALPPDKGTTAENRRKPKQADDDELIRRESIPLERREEIIAMLNAPASLRHDEGVNVPAALSSANTRGSDPAGASFSASPDGTYVKSYRPTLIWSAPGNAQTFVVSLWDSKDRLVDKAQTSHHTWQTNKQLADDEFYRWEVEAMDASGQPLPFLIQGAFSTLTYARRAEVEKDEKIYSQSHLLLGITYFKVGLLDEAEREFKLLAAANPNSSKARGLLRRVQAARINGRQIKNEVLP